MRQIRLAIFVVPALLLAACDSGQPATPTPAEPTKTPPAGMVLTPTVASTTDLGSEARGFVTLLQNQDFKGAESKFDSTMQSALPEDKLSETWKTLLIQVGALKTCDGTQTAKVQGYDVVYVECQFEKSNINVQVTYDKDGKVAGLFFKPAPASTETLGAGPTETPAAVNHDSYEERDVKVGKGEWELPGTLSLPKGDGPFPAVVLVQGSGPQDRDETIGPNKPFADIAAGLASRGIAVLRYDKRSYVYGAKMKAIENTITLDQETTDDALAAVELLRGTGKIDKNRIFVLGHSLGGMAAPRIGARDPEIAGLIVMAGPTQPFEDAILEQFTYIYSLEGTPTPDKQKELDDLKAQVALVKSKDLTKDTPSDKLPLGIPASYWLDLRDYHPAEAAKSLKQPMLILQGEADYQVTMQDFQGWKDALGSRSNVQFKSYPGLYHLFMPAAGEHATPSDYSNPGHVLDQVIGDIADWISSH